MASPLAISEKVSGASVRLDLAGEIDMSNASEVSTRVFQHLDDPAVADVVADLSAVTFLGSAGLSALAAGRHRADSLGKTFHIEHAHDHVAEVIEITGLRDFLGNTDPA